MRGLPWPLQRGHWTPQRNADRGLRVARLNAQVEIDDAVAVVAGNDQPVMFGNERGGDLRPEPSLAVGGVEAAHGGQRLALRRPVALHALYGLDSLVAMWTAIFLGHVRFPTISWFGLAQEQGSLPT
jgi:hypothetical protein